jgi:hypothetical protein
MSEKGYLPSILRRVPTRNVSEAINRGCAPPYSRNSTLWAWPGGRLIRASCQGTRYRAPCIGIRSSET